MRHHSLGLDQESDYGWQVQANCGSTDGMSSWSHIGTFTTHSACSTPDNLTATTTTATTADLSWAGYTDTYNVQYREGDPTAPATIILTANDVWGDGSGYQMLLDADANMYGQSFSDFSDFEYTILIYGVGVTNSSGVATVNFTENIPSSGNLYVVVTTASPSVS